VAADESARLFCCCHFQSRLVTETENYASRFFFVMTTHSVASAAEIAAMVLMVSAIFFLSISYGRIRRRGIVVFCGGFYCPHLLDKVRLAY
jgi:hypothetical protein